MFQTYVGQGKPAASWEEGGALEVVTARTDAVNQHGRLCVRQQTVLVVRVG